MLRTNIRIGKYANIFEYPNIRHTLVQVAQIGGRGGGEVIWAMPERKHSFFYGGVPY